MIKYFIIDTWIGMKVDATETSARDYTRSYNGYPTTGMVHTVTHLHAGQTVWMESLSSNSHYSTASTALTGLLIQPDF